MSYMNSLVMANIKHVNCIKIKCTIEWQLYGAMDRVLSAILLEWKPHTQALPCFCMKR